MASTPLSDRRPDRPRVRCPQCGRLPTREAAATPEAARAYPFCSTRCADLDLGRWFDGTYTVPVVEEDASPISDDPEEER